MRLSTFLGLAVFLGFVGLLVWIIWKGYCSRSCDEVVSKASELAAAGRVRDALLAIDDIDASCDCAGFSEDDEPPQAAMARTCLNLLREAYGEAEAAQAISAAEGSILRGLAPP
jgi:hypothetical protein